MTQVILADTSSSMIAMTGRRRAIDVLRDVLKDALKTAPDAQLYAFSSWCERVPEPLALPEASGGTDLTVALQTIAPLTPTLLIVISDGEPNDADSALAEARKLKTQIATRFVGSDDDFAAIAFMRALAWCSADGRGDAQVIGLGKHQALTTDLKKLLTYQGR